MSWRHGLERAGEFLRSFPEGLAAGNRLRNFCAISIGLIWAFSCQAGIFYARGSYLVGALLAVVGYIIVICLAYAVAGSVKSSLRYGWAASLWWNLRGATPQNRKRQSSRVAKQ